MNKNIDLINNALVDHCEENRDYYREQVADAKKLFAAAKQELGIDLYDLLEENEELVMQDQVKPKGTRYFRATFISAVTPDMQITIEFEAPFPVDPSIDYSELALRSFLEEVAQEHVKIRDIEPIES